MSNGTDVVARASPRLCRHSSLTADADRETIPIENSVATARRISDAGFASMGDLSSDYIDGMHPSKDSPRRHRKHSSDYYSLLSLHHRRDALGKDNYGMTEDEASAEGRAKMDPGGSFQSQSSHGSSVDWPWVDTANHPKHSSSQEHRNHTSDYFSVINLSISSPNADNSEMAEDEAGAQRGAEMYAADNSGMSGDKANATVGGHIGMQPGDQDGPVQGQHGGDPSSTERHPPADSEACGESPDARRSTGNDSGPPPPPAAVAASPRTPSTEDIQNAGDRAVAAGNEEGLITRVAVGSDPEIFSFGGDSRKGSEASIYTLSDFESSRSGSVDSAVDMLYVRPRSRVAARYSIYEPIVEISVPELGAETPPSAEGVHVPRAPSASPDRPQMRAPDDAAGFKVEDTADPCRRHPAVRFIRFVWRLLTVCIVRRRPVRSVEASYENSAYSAPDAAGAVQRGSTDAETLPTLSSAVQPAHHEAPQPSPPPSPESQSPPECPPPARGSCGAAVCRKDRFLSSFDQTCSRARDAGLDVTGRVVQIDNFAAAMLDSDGGCLSIDAVGVHLTVPPGAIPEEDSPQRVYLYVHGGATSDRSHLTPYVHCGPSGFQFHTDVFLTLPHCAKDALDKEFAFDKFTSAGSQTVRNPNDGIVLVGRKSLTVSTDHFCGITAGGDIDEKFMLVCPFVKQCRGSGEVVIHLRVLDNLAVNLQEVEREEGALGFGPGAIFQELVVQKTDQEVVASLGLSSERDSWHITQPPAGNERVISSKYLWREYTEENVRAFPCKEFCAARNTSSPDKVPFAASLKVHQVQREQDGVECTVWGRDPTEPDQPDQNTDEAMFGLMWEQIKAARDTWPRSHQEIFERTSSVLDPKSPVEMDWRYLVENLFRDEHHGHRWVENIRERAERGQIRSPTKYVLGLLFEDSENNREETLRRLDVGLSKMLPPRPDLGTIVCDLKKLLPAQPEQNLPKITRNRDDSQYYSSGSVKDYLDGRHTAVPVIEI